MSKQQGYQQLSADAPYGEDYGFAARLPQAGGSYQTDKASSSSGAAGAAPMGYPPVAYPPAAYAGAPVAGYPVMTPSMAGGMAGPVGMGAHEPLGRRDRKRARRQAKRQRRAQGGGKCRAKPALMIFGGPVALFVGLVKHAIRAGKEHQGKQPPRYSNQEPDSHPKW